jgi:predicted dienelactone hydrolase
MVYDPFSRGLFPAGVETLEAVDSTRGRRFPVEVWYPAAADGAEDVFDAPRGPRKQQAARNAPRRGGTYPLAVFSHHSGGQRRSATYLCTHLASHGYVVAALNHSEVVAPELARPAAETDEQRAARMKAMIESRVPDLRFLVDFMLEQGSVDTGRIGAVGHSFGGWTVLAALDKDERLRAAVALAPGGSRDPKPGILPLQLSFQRNHSVPSLFLAAENDISLPLPGMIELFGRAPQPKRLLVLQRADHLHFIDEVEEEHEAVRAMQFPGVLAWIPREMLPVAELCSGEEAHRFVRGLTLAHFDATLRDSDEAHAFLTAFGVVRDAVGGGGLGLADTQGEDQ